MVRDGFRERVQYSSVPERRDGWVGTCVCVAQILVVWDVCMYTKLVVVVVGGRLEGERSCVL